MIYPEQFETGSGGFVWENIAADSLLSELRLHVYYAYYMQTDNSWAGSQFVNHYNRVYYVKSGEAVLRFNDFDLTMKPGYLYLIPPYSLNSHYCDESLEFYWVHFHALVGGDLDLFSLFAKPEAIKVDSPAQTLACFEQLTESIKQKQPSSILRRNMLLTQLLLPFIDRMMGNSEKSEQAGYLRFLPTLKFVQQNLAEQIQIKQLAEQLGLSLEHFSRSFKQELNISPKRYILQKRMALAKQLLLLDNLAVGEVAIRSGYPDVYHFSKIFKQEMGLSPSQYRRKFKPK